MHTIDTHVHLDQDLFNEDLDEVIKRARNAGVSRMITVGTDLKSSRDSVTIADRFPEVWAAVGVHPHEAARTCGSDLSEVEKLISHPKVVAIGEIGLDYYYHYSPPDVQQFLFSQQLKIARRFDLPIIIHVREAMEDAIKVIDSSGSAPWSGVFHCFSGTSEEVPKVLERGFHLSFTGVVTFKNYKNTDAVRAVPINRLLLETDAPYMTPVPHRGKRNEPSYILYTAHMIADILGVSFETLMVSSYKNALTLFGLE
ncbi:TatD family hydrolase [bacterium]|nr:TatD family hydrolase [bacterium]